ncbi:hypothetical protein ACFLYO_10715, partial [Chloroflexota bacterium]
MVGAWRCFSAKTAENRVGLRLAPTKSSNIIAVQLFSTRIPKEPKIITIEDFLPQVIKYTSILADTIHFGNNKNLLGNSTIGYTESSCPLAIKRFLMSSDTQAPVSLPNTETHYLRSSVADQKYKLFISLPEGYAESEESYPVLYVTDANWFFSIFHAFVP